MPATFADIPWGSDLKSAITLARNKGFTILDSVSTMARVKGKIYGKSSNIFIKFDAMGMFEVAVFIDVAAESSRVEYDAISSILIEKYGPPVYEKVDGSVWQSAKLTGGTEIVLSMSSNHKEVGIVYQSPANSQSEQSEYAKRRESARDLL